MYGPVVFAGVLNALESNHDPRYAVFGEWEYDFYRAFGQAGFDDTFHVKEPARMTIRGSIDPPLKVSATDTDLPRLRQQSPPCCGG